MSELKRQHDDEHLQCLKIDEAERRRLEEEARLIQEKEDELRRDLQTKSR